MIEFDPSNFKTKGRKLVSLALTRPQRGLRRHAYFMAVCFAVLSVGVFFIPWQQTAVGKGRVIAYSPSEREQQINAPISGRIARWHIAEGQRIKAGDLIVELTDFDPQMVDRLRLEREALSARVAAAGKAVETAKRNFDRQKNLYRKGLSSRKEFEKAELDYMGYLVEESEANASMARMDVRLARQLTQRVTAPTDGTILRVQGGQGGQIVKQGDILCILVPETRSRTVELWLDGMDLPLVEEGRHVRLQFEGWPAIQFGGWPSVAVGTFGGRVALLDPMNSGDGRFRVFVQPDNENEWPEGRFLRQGVRVNGWVLLNQVSLGYEIWRQLNGFPPSVDPSDGFHPMMPRTKNDAAITINKK